MVTNSTLPHGARSIQERRGKFYANYRKPDGKQTQLAFATRGEAEAFLLERLAAKKRAKAKGEEFVAPPEEGEPWTVAALLSGYKRSLINHKPGTWRNQETQHERLQRLFGPVHGDAVTAELLDDLRDHLRNEEEHKKKRKKGADAKKGLSPSTTRQTLQLLGRALDWGRARGYVSAPDPFLLHTLPDKETPKPDVLDDEELDRLVESTAETVRPMVRILSELALRWSECTALRVRDYKPSKRLLHVEGQLLPGGQRVEYLKTAAGHRKLSVSDELHEELSALAKKRGGAGLFFVTPIKAKKEPVPGKKPRPGGVPYSRTSWIRDFWNPALAEAGLDDRHITPHGLRHSRLSLMAEAGVPTSSLAAFAGHEDPAFTMRTYGSHHASASLKPEVYLGRR